MTRAVMRAGAGLAALAVLCAAPGASGAQVGAPSGTITVSAASSLSDVFPVIAREFARRHPNVVIRFNFAGSASLVEQVVSGAPVDVLATASRETMAKAVRARAVGTPVVFARNSMTIAVPPGNPGRISGVGDLGRPGVVLAVCDPAVPCGAAAAEVFRRNGVLTSPVTRELDVRAVLGKVMADEVDAGVVYVTDVRAAGARVESVPIPAATNAMTAYPVAVAAESGNQAAAKAFAAFVASSASARGVLRAYGFSGP